MTVDHIADLAREGTVNIFAQLAARNLGVIFEYLRCRILLINGALQNCFAVAS
jgi:hypothetical protein